MAMIAIMIILVLVLGVAVVGFLNQIHGRFGVAVQQRHSASAATQEGLNYAIHALAVNTSTWTFALNGIFPKGFGGKDESGAANPLQYFNPGQTNYPFTITCSTGPPGASYQVTILVTAYALSSLNATTGQPNPLRSVQALVSQKTMSATLPNGLSASAALEVFHAPTAVLNVIWGPIISYDTSTWTVKDPLDTGRYPRKFAQAGITGAVPRSGSNPPVNSDNQEYWAYTSLGYPPAIDKDAYKKAAQNTTLTPIAGANYTPYPQLWSSCTPNVGCNTNLLPTCTAVPNCGYFVVPPNETAVFGYNDNGNDLKAYYLNQPGAIIYIDATNANASVKFDKVGFDLKGRPNTTAASIFPSSGAVIVDGNLTWGWTSGANHLHDMRIPPTRKLEYPYFPTHPTCYDCSGVTSGVCMDVNCNGPTMEPELRGFLYVTGNYDGGSRGVHIVGALRVDGQMSSSAGTQWIHYDDEINHSILVNNLELQVDSEQSVSAR